MKSLKHYLLNIAISVDQLINTVFGGRPDETMSSRAYRMQDKKHKYFWWVAAAINTLFFWQEDHCKQAYQSEVNKVQLPKHFQK